MALSGENGKIFSSEISNRRTDIKNSILPKKSTKYAKKLHNSTTMEGKKEKFPQISSSNNKIQINSEFLDYKSRRKSIGE